MPPVVASPGPQRSDSRLQCHHPPSRCLNLALCADSPQSSFRLSSHGDNPIGPCLHPIVQPTAIAKKHLLARVSHRKLPMLRGPVPLQHIHIVSPDKRIMSQILSAYYITNPCHFPTGFVRRSGLTALITVARRLTRCAFPASSVTTCILA